MKIPHMTTKPTTKRRKATSRTKVSDGFVYRGVRIKGFLKPTTKRTRAIDEATRKVMQIGSAGSTAR
jgi:hypothetical protein